MDGVKILIYNLGLYNLDQRKYWSNLDQDDTDHEYIIITSVPKKVGFDIKKV
jgi:hypothetical protein